MTPLFVFYLPHSFLFPFIVNCFLSLCQFLLSYLPWVFVRICKNLPFISLSTICYTYLFLLYFCHPHPPSALPTLFIVNYPFLTSSCSILFSVFKSSCISCFLPLLRYFFLLSSISWFQFFTFLLSLFFLPCVLPTLPSVLFPSVFLLTFLLPFSNSILYNIPLFSNSPFLFLCLSLGPTTFSFVLLSNVPKKT